MTELWIKKIGKVLVWLLNKKEKKILKNVTFYCHAHEQRAMTVFFSIISAYYLS